MGNALSGTPLSFICYNVEDDILQKKNELTKKAVEADRLESEESKVFQDKVDAEIKRIDDRFFAEEKVSVVKLLHAYYPVIDGDYKVVLAKKGKESDEEKKKKVSEAEKESSKAQEEYLKELDKLIKEFDASKAKKEEEGKKKAEEKEHDKKETKEEPAKHTTEKKETVDIVLEA